MTLTVSRCNNKYDLAVHVGHLEGALTIRFLLHVQYQPLLFPLALLWQLPTLRGHDGFQLVFEGLKLGTEVATVAVGLFQLCLKYFFFCGDLTQGWHQRVLLSRLDTAGVPNVRFQPFELNVCKDQWLLGIETLSREGLIEIRHQCLKCLQVEYGLQKLVSVFTTPTLKLSQPFLKGDWEKILDRCWRIKQLDKWVEILPSLSHHCFDN